MKKEIYKNIKGFTLIELLLVVSIIGILAGAVVGLVDVNKTKDRAKDGVRQANIEKVIQGIESFYTIEDFYPAESSADSSHNPLLGADGTVLSTYLKAWPGDATNPYIYEKIDDDTFLVGVANSFGNYYKYYSTWSSIQNCTGSWTVDDECPGTAPIIPGPPEPPTCPPSPCTDSECAACCVAQGSSTGACNISGVCRCQ